MTTKKGQITVPFDVVGRVQQRLGLSDPEFAAAMGYSSGGVIGGWREKDTAPKVASIAAECLERRLSPEAANRLVSIAGPAVVILKADNPEALAFLELMVGRAKDLNIIKTIKV